MIKLPLAAAAILAGSLATSPALAQDDGGWRVSLTPYLWLAGVEGDVGALPGRPPTEVNAEFPGIFDALSGAFMGTADVGYGRFGVIGDVAYLKLSGDKNVRVRGVPVLGAEIELESTAATLVGYYRAVETERTDVDLLAGVRYNAAAVELDLSRAGGPGRSGDASKHWTDPVVGVRATHRLTDRLSLRGYGDYGGFGVSSDAVWQAVGLIDYRFNSRVSVAGGYRYYVVDFKDDAFDYDLALGGPIVGVTFHF